MTCEIWFLHEAGFIFALPFVFLTNRYDRGARQSSLNKPNIAMFSSPRSQQKSQETQIEVLSRDTRVERTLNRLLTYQAMVDASQDEFDVCERLSTRKIECFGTDQIGNQSVFDDSRNKKRSIDAEFKDMPPKEIYESRLFAREELPKRKEALEYAQMEQAEYVYQLQKQCTSQSTHQYVVFANPKSKGYVEGGVDVFAMRCLHCFLPIADLGRVPKTVRVYHTAMNFDQAQQLRIAQVSGLQPLY